MHSYTKVLSYPLDDNSDKVDDNLDKVDKDDKEDGREDKKYRPVH